MIRMPVYKTCRHIHFHICAHCVPFVKRKVVYKGKRHHSFLIFTANVQQSYAVADFVARCFLIHIFIRFCLQSLKKQLINPVAARIIDFCSDFGKFLIRHNNTRMFFIGILCNDFISYFFAADIIKHIAFGQLSHHFQVTSPIKLI